jgi:hypothetical protein
MSPTDKTLPYEVGPGYMLSLALSTLTFGKFCLPTNSERRQPIHKTAFILDIVQFSPLAFETFRKIKFTATFERL